MAIGHDANSKGHPYPAVRWHFVLAVGRWQQGQSKDHKQMNDMQPPGQPELAQNLRARKIKAEPFNGQRPYG